MKIATLPESELAKIQDLVNLYRTVKIPAEIARCKAKNFNPAVANAWEKCVSVIAMDLISGELSEKGIDNCLVLGELYMDENFCKAVGRAD